MKNIYVFLTSLVAISIFVFVYYFANGLSIVEVNGGCSERSSPYMQKYFDDGRKITFCDSGDKYVGEIRSQIFRGLSEIWFSYSGYPGNEKVNFQLISNKGSAINIELPTVGERWVEYRLKIPEEFIGAPIELVAKDNAVDKFGWIGLGNIRGDRTNPKIVFILKVVSVSFFLLVFYSVGLSLLLPKCGLMDSPVVLVVLVGILGYGVFNLYLINKWIGSAFSGFLVALILILAVRMCVKGMWVNFKYGLSFFMPISLITLIINYIGYYPFEFSGVDFWQNGANRWLSLPIDSWLPKIFADQIYQGELLRPMYGDWLSSDRPPLQTGIYLIFYPFGKGDDVVYQVVATMLQAMILIPIWRIIAIFKCGAAQSWMLFTFSISSLFIINGLFVWPKLISAAYVAICFYYLNFAIKSKTRNIMIGASVSLAMLSHGGAFFALFGVFLHWSIVSAKKLSWSEVKDLIVWIVVAIALYYPWVWYGKYYDPQYSRLIKWHLAGVIAPSQENVISTLWFAYSKLSLGDWFAVRVANFNAIVTDFIVFDRFLWSSDYYEFIKTARDKSFFKLFYSLWLLSPFVVFPAILALRNYRIDSDVLKLFAGALLGMLLWVLLMFEPGSTVIHQGSYYTYMALFVSGQILLWLSNKIAFYIANISNICISMLLYVFSPIKLVEDVYYVMGVFLLFILFWNSLLAWNNNATEK